jgi:hypothetical protein
MLSNSGGKSIKIDPDDAIFGTDLSKVKLNLYVDAYLTFKWEDATETT